MKRLLQQHDFKALFDSTLDAIMVADDAGVYLAVNVAACKLLKAPEEAIIGRTVTAFLEPEKHAQALQNWHEFLESGERAGEVELICADGSRCTAEFKARANFLPGQHLSLLRDVTERKQAQIALVESNRQMLSILESVSDMVLAFDPDWRFLYANPQSETILGRPPHEVLGRNLWEEYPGTRGTEFEEAYLKAAREKVPTHFQGYVAAMGMWLEVHVYPAAVGVTVYIRDINDRKQAEDNLRFLAEAGAVLSSSIEHEQVIENLAQITLSHLADWCSIDVLEEDEIKRLAVVHRDPAKMEFSREFGRLYPPSINDRTAVPEVIRTGEAQIWAEIPDELLVASAPDQKWLEMVRGLGMKSLMLVPLVTGGRTIGAMTLVREQSGRSYSQLDLVVAQELGRRAGGAVENGRLFRDRTQALHTAEQALHSAEAANRAKDEFLATLSHELRTPLNAIVGWAQLVRDGRLSDADKIQGLDTIYRNGLRQARLVEDLLDVSRIITGKLRLDVTPTELSTVIEDAVEAVLPAAQAKDIRLQRVLDSGTSLVSGDANRLQQVVWNLLSNAIKFTPKGGRVQVRLERVHSHVEITVLDSGEGIPPEVLPHVFERFLQADQTSTRNYGGLGLGLAIVRHLVEMHGGTVEADSGGEGQGATFTVKLPLLAARPAEPAHENFERRRNRAANSDGGEAVMECPPELAGIHVLVVDDEEDARQLVRAILERCGAKVTTASCVGQALEAVQALRPDVLVSDVGMPDEDGYTLIHKVRALTPAQGGQTPAAALTAYARAEDRISVLRAGFQIHLPKPVDPAELLVVIANLSRRYENS